MTVVRPLRRDAEVNLARVSAAARDAFAEQGYEGVQERMASGSRWAWARSTGASAVKANLIKAVVDVSAKERNRAIAEEVLAEVAPGEAVFEFVRRCIEAPSCWRATIAAPPGARAGTGLDDLAPLLDAMLSRGRRAGTVRHDAVVTDIVVALMSVRAIAYVRDARGATPSRRFLELVLDRPRPRCLGRRASPRSRWPVWTGFSHER